MHKKEVLEFAVRVGYLAAVVADVSPRLEAPKHTPFLENVASLLKEAHDKVEVSTY